MKASTLLWATFSPSTIRLLKSIARFLADRHHTSYVVGGSVRDALLGVPTADIDIMIEGDLPETIKSIQQEWDEILPGSTAPHRVVSYPKYRTAKLLFPGEVVPGVEALDFSASRSEIYPTPGGPPIVNIGTLEQDLKRRDFSVNAMAIALAPNHFGEIVDLFCGQEHLNDKMLCVLHPESFRDDPMRLIRGVRFAARFGFTWSPETNSLFEEALRSSYIESVKPERRFEEFKKALSERRVANVVESLSKHSLLPQVSPRALFDERTKTLLQQIEKYSASGVFELQGESYASWKVVFCALHLSLSEADFLAVLAMTKLADKQSLEFLQIRDRLRNLYAS